ncbi:MAG: efflux RND transporter periplasmic adaptor subunit [Maioricimonas sp. JB045]
MSDVQPQRFRGGAAPQAGGKSNRTVRYVFAIAAVLICGVIAAVSRIPSLTAAGDAPARASVNRMLPVRTTRLISVGTLETRHTFTGVLEAARVSQLGFERSGRVVELLVDEGERVEAGQPLARLDVSTLDVKRRQLEAQRLQAAAVLAELRAGPRTETIAAARASVEQHEAELELWKLTCTRNERLHDRNAITEQQYDDARLNMAAAQARLDAARHQLRELEEGTRPEQVAAQEAAVEQLVASLALVATDIEKSTLRAPFAGTIARRLIDEGTVATATTAVVELVDTEHLEAHIGLPAETAARLVPGAELVLRISDREITGRMRAVRPVLDPVTRTQVVIVDVAASDAGPSVPGQVVRLDVDEAGDVDGYWVPLSALAQGPRGLWSLYAAQPETGIVPAQAADVAVVERRTVEVVHTEEDRALVRGTVYPGDRIVVDGLHRVVPGQRVRVVSETGDSQSPEVLANLDGQSG